MGESGQIFPRVASLRRYERLWAFEKSIFLQAFAGEL